MQALDENFIKKVMSKKDVIQFILNHSKEQELVEVLRRYAEN